MTAVESASNDVDRSCEFLPFLTNLVASQLLEEAQAKPEVLRFLLFLTNSIACHFPQEASKPSEMGKKCSTCGKTYKNKRAFNGHKMKCKSPKNPEQNAAGQEEASSSVGDRKDLLNFHIERRPRSSRGAVKEMDGGNEVFPSEAEIDAAEGLSLLQYRCGKDTSSDNEPGIDYSGVESAADNSDAVQEDNPCLPLILGKLNKIISDRNSASVNLCGGAEKCGNEALSLEETGLIHNDDVMRIYVDSQRLVDCPENSVVVEPKRPKLDLKVSDSSDNPASDGAQGGNNDASRSGTPKLKQTSLTEPMATEADREQEQKSDVLEAPLPLATTSVDQSGTDSPGDESAADTSDEVRDSMVVLQVAQGLLDLRNCTDR
ncbi:hypothetical protein TRIUR3_08050 [Triticum urartu]|uniref:Uncharacterized protein n=2 Tax=Triticum urartu TaxID=4572 RepID=M7YW47_TRIUA|nr:hypothetical protein TRIUR3_08050 [Triticum urartu]